MASQIFLAEKAEAYRELVLLSMVGNNDSYPLGSIRAGGTYQRLPVEQILIIPLFPFKSLPYVAIFKYITQCSPFVIQLGAQSTK
jgi:hypothetical protein